MNYTRVKVRLLSSYLQTLVGMSEQELLLEGLPTVGRVLEKLSEKHGRNLGEQLLDNERGELRAGVIVLINDRVAQNIKEAVKSGDVITITIAYEGG